MGELKPQSSTADLDALFGCLADSRRRTLVRILAEEETPLGLQSVTERMRAREGTAFETSGRESQQDTVISLVHTHLPKLTEANIVAMDFETDRIMEGDQFTTALSHLEME